MSFSVTTVLYGAALALLQIVAAIPWLAVVFLRREEIVQMVREPFSPTMMRRYGIALILILVGACFGLLVQDPTALQFSGHVYGATLQLQLTADLFVLIFLVLLAVWPKGGAVALAAFREGVRQPMFWLIFGIGFAALTIAPFWPYFTFGEDHIMVKDLGLDTVMLAAVFFGALAASISITEEIEG